MAAIYFRVIEYIASCIDEFLGRMSEFIDCMDNVHDIKMLMARIDTKRHASGAGDTINLIYINVIC